MSIHQSKRSSKDLSRMATKEEVAQLITDKGTQIRELKTAKSSKELIDKAVAELLALKERFDFYLSLTLIKTAIL